jgi:transposase
MRCSSDLRKRVIEFVRGGGSKAEAARRFQVSRTSVYNWTDVADGLAYERPGPKGPRRLDWTALRTHVARQPEATQKERARHFGVSRHCSWHALQRMGLSRMMNEKGLQAKGNRERRLFCSKEIGYQLISFRRQIVDNLLPHRGGLYKIVFFEQTLWYRRAS